MHLSLKKWKRFSYFHLKICRRISFVVNKNQCRTSNKMEIHLFHTANILFFSRKSPLNNSVSVSSETEELTNRWILNWETQLGKIWQIVESVNSPNRFVDCAKTTSHQDIDDGWNLNPYEDLISCSVLYLHPLSSYIKISCRYHKTLLSIKNIYV